MAIQRNVRVYLEADDRLVFNADADEIEIIFNNLISNAVKYNKEGGEVNIGIRKESAGLMITVRDTGIGMNEEEVSRLFQEFVRIKNAKTKNITGSGLGLSIVKKLVEESYEGRISAASVPDEGTTFTVVLNNATNL